ncbi:MAG: prepilin-type N-terminal cleavage/methylation domain-containing protein [Nitrospirae bacterium]|nr:prepilin-type N-terminal cleavage/methylation domain-containing protein [Nitrospirota bacterium]
MTKDITELNGCPQNNNGFTLVEVMIAMTVLLVGMLGVLSMQYYAIVGNASSREVRTATNLSAEIIEQLKSTPYDNLALTPPATPSAATVTGGVNFTRRSWVVSDCIAMNIDADDNTCGAGLMPSCTEDPDTTMLVPVSAVRVRTCWTDKDGLQHFVTLDSIRWDENGTL